MLCYKENGHRNFLLVDYPHQPYYILVGAAHRISRLYIISENTGNEKIEVNRHSDFIIVILKTQCLKHAEVIDMVICPAPVTSKTKYLTGRA